MSLRSLQLYVVKINFDIFALGNKKMSKFYAWTYVKETVKSADDW